MKITKYVHSCLVVETDNRVGLMDPGVFSWESGTFEVDMLPRLDDIIITHDHPDHLHLPFFQALVAAFPQARISTLPSLAAKLQAIGFANVTSEQTADVQFFAAAHEPNEPLGPTPENTGVHYLEYLTDPGDSFQLSETKPILALPLTAPWGALTHAAALAIDLKPRYILPIHDWHWNAAARKQTYERLVSFFREQGITFVPLADGKPVEL